MDSSFSNSSFSLGSRARNSLASTNRKSLYGSQRKGLNSSRFSLSTRHGFAMQMVTKSDEYVTELYGLPLPVLVNEALTFSDRNATVTVNCSENGWAWAVCNRRLLVWQYKDSALSDDASRLPSRRVASAQCRELSLPHCDIGHKAGLVTVFVGEGQQMASCLAASPTGDIRYWPSIAHDGSSIDATGILEGQEFDELLTLSPIAYILATTTCNLVLLQLQLHNGRHTIVHRTIRPPTGFLGGIGKKFASIIIGMNSNTDRENKLIRVCFRSVNLDWHLTVLADRWIQRWTLSSNGIETFLYEDSEMIRRIRDCFHQKLFSHRDVNEVDVRLLDMHVTANGHTLVLAAAINISHTPQFHYAVVTLNESTANSYVLRNFCSLKHNTFVSAASVSSALLPMRLLVNLNVVYVWDENLVHQITLGADDLCGNGEPSEKIEFPKQGDKLMAATINNRVPLIFSRANGLMSINAADADPFDSLNCSMQSEFDPSGFMSQSVAGTAEQGNLTMMDLNPDEVYDSDGVSQLKAAFIYHLKGMALQCSEAISVLLDSNEDLDPLVITISRDLVDDMPAADPRWEEQIVSCNNRYSLGSSSSMQIIHQLKEKKLVLLHFVEFLHATDLWSRLGTTTERGTIRPTGNVLSDITEKLVATIALKRIHSNHSRVMDDAIHDVLKQRNESIKSALTPQDVFYVKVTRITDIFRVLSNVAVGESGTQSEMSSSNRISSALSDVNTIILTVLDDITKFREAKRGLFKLPTLLEDRFEYLPWTAQSGKTGLRDTLAHQISVTLKLGARTSTDAEQRQRHYKQIVEMIDFLLDGRKSFLDSIADWDKYSVLYQQYETQRNDLIQPLLEDGQLELATKLAEKYLDFQILVQICDRTENQHRLDEYIAKYQALNFSQFAINWHLKQNKRGDLFERFKHQQADLSRFLSDHPSLAWVQAVFNGDLDKAGRVLFDLADNELELVARKKSMLSLAKLVLLAGEEDMKLQIETVNAELRLIEYQEQLPSYLLDTYGYDVNDQKVFKAEEIINLLISDENAAATEVEYRKALELLMYVADPTEVRHKIWCSAILRDDWSTYNINAPQEDLQNLLFFKLVDLCFFLDTDLNRFLPPIEEFLDAPELEALIEDKSFQFLFKLGYEYINESYRQQQKD